MDSEEVGSCICCGSEQKHSMGAYPSKSFGFFDEAYPLNRCLKCGHVYVSPRPTSEFLNAFYSSDEVRILQKFQLLYISPIPSAFNWVYFESIKRITEINRIHPITVDTRILDVGCGVGLFLHFAQKQFPFIAIGNDVAVDSVRYGRETLNLDIRHGDLLSCAFESGYFDIVLMAHILEHIPDAMETMREVHRILKPDGLLVIEVPCYDSLLSAIFKENWAFLYHPIHLHQFTPETLRLFLNRAGFTVLGKIKVFVWPFELCGSLLNQLNFNYARFCADYLSSKWKRIRAVSTALLLLPLLMIDLVMVQLISKLLGKGSVMRVLARKTSADEPAR